jgi:hypothetical protein
LLGGGPDPATPQPRRSASQMTIDEALASTRTVSISKLAGFYGFTDAVRP